MGMNKTELLARLPRGPMRTAHQYMTNDFIRESLKAWEKADDIERSDIMAFFRCDGPVTIAALKCLHKSGVLRTS